MTALPPDGLSASLADRYAIERELGRGGMATVYLARDLQHDRPVALKVLHPELAATLGPERFRREIEVAAKFQHPHILPVHDSGETPAAQLWFTMPYVEGESLRERIRRERQLPLDEAVRIACEAALALDYAHDHGVVHRDIKPENILLTQDGSTLVADFGIARVLDEGLSGTGEALTATGMVVGTPQYMSPEQAAGERKSARAPTSTRWARCRTRCWRVSHRSRARRRRRSSRRCSVASRHPCGARAPRARDAWIWRSGERCRLYRQTGFPRRWISPGRWRAPSAARPLRPANRSGGRKPARLPACF